MNNNSKLRPDLQSIIDQFCNLTTNNCELKKSLIVQEEITNLLGMASNKAQEQLDKLIPHVEQYVEYTKKKIREHKNKIRKLEDEIEIIQCEKSLLEEKYREEIINLTKTHQSQLDNLEKDYKEEIRELKLVVESQKNTIGKLTEEVKKNSDFVHPALFQTPAKAPKKAKTRKSTAQVFDWPSLDVQLTQPKKNNEEVEVKKKRRLYTPDNESIVEINLND